MADPQALCDHVRDLMKTARPGRSKPISVTEMINGIGRYFQEDYPHGCGTTVLREVLTGRRPAGYGLLECIPAFATILDTTEYELLAAADVLPVVREVAVGLGLAASQFQKAFTTVVSAVRRLGLDTEAGEAVVVNRLLQATRRERGFDYRIEIWPVVRGTHYRFHFRSWIILQPVEPDPDRQRDRTRDLERLPAEERRERIRTEIIGADIWRSLGLRWRWPPPLEYTGDIGSGLFIEVPIEERNSLPTFDPTKHPAVSPSRILIISGLWSHAEGIVTMLSDALEWGSYDRRYNGFDPDAETVMKENLCRAKLSELLPYYIWSIPERADFLRRLRPEIVAAAHSHLIVLITYSDGMATTAAQAFELDVDQIDAAQKEAHSIAAEINQTYPIIHVEISDADVCYPDPETRRLRVDRDRLTDHIRFSAAEILVLLRDECSGPPIGRWGKYFAGLQHGTDPMPWISRRRSTVNWLTPRTLHAEPTAEAETASG